MNDWAPRPAAYENAEVVARTSAPGGIVAQPASPSKKQKTAIRPGCRTLILLAPPRQRTCATTARNPGTMGGQGRLSRRGQSVKLGWASGTIKQAVSLARPGLDSAFRLDSRLCLQERHL